MSFRGIPDAQLDPHPRLTWLVEMGFDLGVRLLYRKQEIWPDDARLVPGTLIISNHQRDADVPVIGTTLCQRRGLRFRWPLSFFVAREDLFRGGFLAEYFGGWPLIGPLLGHVRLQWFFKAARAYPMRRVREFSLIETVEALRDAGLGSAEVTEVFNARGQHELHARLGALPLRVAELDGRRLRMLPHWGLRRLRLSALRRIAPAFRATVQQQLAGYARLLDAGRVVYIAPEGLISETGRFGRVRQGTRWLYRHAAAPPAVLPVALSYDALAPGKRRVLVHVGRLVRRLDASSEALFAAQLRRLIQELYMLNPSHLIARFLVAGPLRFTTAEFRAWMQRALDLARTQGVALDPLLQRVPAGELWVRRLRWLQRRRLLDGKAGDWHNVLDRTASPGWQQPANIVRYLDNTLAEAAPGLSRELPA